MRFMIGELGDRTIPTPLLSIWAVAPLLLAVAIFVYFCFAMKRECEKLDEPRDSSRSTDAH